MKAISSRCLLKMAVCYRRQHQPHEDQAETLPHSIVERAVEILSYQVPVSASLYNPLVGKGIRHICEDASLAWVERQ